MMRPKMFSRMVYSILFATSKLLFAKPCSSKILKGNHIGIQFTVYEPDSYDETLEDVQEKMRLVSTQFQRVFSFGVMARDDETDYKPEEIYNQSFPQAYTAEGASLVNIDNPKPVQLYIGIYPHTDEKLYEKEINIAFDSAEQSEHRSQGTVLGFVIDFKDSQLNLTTLNGVVKLFDSSDLFTNSTVGLRLYCDDILEEMIYLDIIFRHVDKNYF